MTHWQPIDTAPKDGTKILVCCIGVSNTTKRREGMMAVDIWHTHKDHGYDGWGHFNKQYYPATHWMPLPEPPNA